MSPLQSLVRTVQQSKGIAHKQDIAIGMDELAKAEPCQATCEVGDDCAAIKSRDGSYTLLAIEGFMNEFVQDDPWFAGYCGVMVNVSDIAAMGGRPTAVVDAVWTADSQQLKLILQGMSVASRRYQVPIVGGHTNARNSHAQLAVSILGHADVLLSSFKAEPDDVLMAVIDLRGNYRGAGNNWNASTEAPAERLRADLDLMPWVAQQGISQACKDISMAGPLGTALMMLECSGCGGELWPDAFPRPTGVALERWMQTFPSFGFIFSVKPANVDSMKRLFAQRELPCAEVGRVAKGTEVWVSQANQRELLWDFSARPLLACQQVNKLPEQKGDVYASGSI